MAKVAKNSRSSKGGAKPGERRGGRKKGTPNKKTSVQVAAVQATGVTPLEYMLDVMRQPIPKGASISETIAISDQRFEAAKAAAPYVHPRLAAIEHTGKDGGPIKADITLSPDEAYKRMLG